MILTEKQVSQFFEYSQKWRGADRELFSSFFLLSRSTAIGSFLADEKKQQEIHTGRHPVLFFKKILLSSPSSVKQMKRI